MAQRPNTKEQLEEAVAAYVRHGGERHAARALNMPFTTLHNRLEAARRRGIEVPEVSRATVKGRIETSIQTGTLLIGSDFHYWPGPVSTAHRAFVHFAKRLRKDKNRPLRAVILNGDILDFCAVSRHPPIGWDSIPTVVQEIECAQERTDEIAAAAGKGVDRLWPAGNHDLRMETWIAQKAPELRGLKGSSLADHFPLWRPCWSVHINGTVVVKHRGRGGIHATWNNALNSGLTIITAHLHSQKVTPVTDYRGTRWGVDCGCIADPYGPQFQDYLEDGFRNWVSGFCVLSFQDGELLPPELVTVIRPDAVIFRGEIIEV